jgi:hypothetical protein
MRIFTKKLTYVSWTMKMLKKKFKTTFDIVTVQWRAAGSIPLGSGSGFSIFVRIFYDHARQSYFLKFVIRQNSAKQTTPID